MCEFLFSKFRSLYFCEDDDGDDDDYDDDYDDYDDDYVLFNDTHR